MKVGKQVFPCKTFNEAWKPSPAHDRFQLSVKPILPFTTLPAMGGIACQESILQEAVEFAICSSSVNLHSRKGVSASFRVGTHRDSIEPFELL